MFSIVGFKDAPCGQGAGLAGVAGWQQCPKTEVRIWARCGGDGGSFALQALQSLFCTFIPLRCRFLIPFACLRIILLDTIAVLIKFSESGLRYGISLFRCFFIPLQRLINVTLNMDTKIIIITKTPLRAYMTLNRPKKLGGNPICERIFP